MVTPDTHRNPYDDRIRDLEARVATLEEQMRKMPETIGTTIAAALKLAQDVRIVDD